MLESVKCSLCGSNDYSVVYKTYSGDISTLDIQYEITGHKLNVPLRIVRCHKCGLVYTNPRPSDTSLASVYMNMTDQLYVEEELGRRLSAQSILKVLKKLRKKGRLLDIGCAAGFLLDEARKLGWEAYGVELSVWAVKYAKDKLGITNIFQGVLGKAGYPNNYFDAVIMKDTIEHLTDPRSTLIEIRRVLKPDGILCVNTPNIDSLISKVLKAKWWGVKQEHLYYFTKKTLYRMLDTTGFKAVKTKSHTRIFTLQYWLDRFKIYSKRLYNIFAFLVKYKIIKSALFRIDFKDQIEVYARKIRKPEYLDELESPIYTETRQKVKTVAVLPAHNNSKTIERTVKDIPREDVDEIILIDDASTDDTVPMAQKLGLKVFMHKTKEGYGATQKTCYTKALDAGADIIVMVHPDYQHDPKAITDLIEPIKAGRADAVLGSRMLKGGALEGGMPRWKHNANILLTALENVVFCTFLTEYHSGFRAYSARLLKTIKFQLNGDGVIFDTEIIAQALLHNFRIEEIPIRTRYFDEAPTIGFFSGIFYGLGVLKTLFKYILHNRTFIKFKQMM